MSNFVRHAMVRVRVLGLGSSFMRLRLSRKQNSRSLESKFETCELSGSTIGFKLDSLLKLIDTCAWDNNKMILIH